MGDAMQQRMGKRLVSGNKTALGGTLVNGAMKEYEDIEVQKRNLELFKHSMIHALDKGLGGRYGEAIQRRDAADAAVSNMIDRYNELSSQYDKSLSEADIEINRLRNINAQRRVIVFERNKGGDMRARMADFQLLTQQRQEVQRRINAIQADIAGMQRALDELDGRIMHMKATSKNSFDSLGESSAKIQKKIQKVERKITSLGYRQKQLLHQIANNMSRAQLRATGCYTGDSSDEDE